MGLVRDVQYELLRKIGSVITFQVMKGNEKGQSPLTMKLILTKGDGNICEKKALH